jgi:CRP/FNR family cyclic AMP-dependent transcriptional regulator
LIRSLKSLPTEDENDSTQAPPHAGRAARRDILSTRETTQIQVTSAYQRSFEDAEIIFDEGDEGIDLYVIQSGQVEITRSSTTGQRTVARLRAGDFFGEMSVVLGEVRTARAVAIGNTELLELDGETLEAMCIERPEIAIRMIQRLAVRLIGAERRLAALGLDELVGPLVRYLWEQGGDDLEAELRISTSLRELASGCELTLQETHEALHQLLDQKLIRLVGDELVAPDRSALSTAMTKFAKAS